MIFSLCLIEALSSKMMNYSCIDTCKCGNLCAITCGNISAGMNVQTVILIEHNLASTCAGKCVQCAGEAENTHTLICAHSVDN